MTLFKHNLFLTIYISFIFVSCYSMHFDFTARGKDDEYTIILFIQNYQSKSFQRFKSTASRSELFL